MVMMITTTVFAISPHSWPGSHPPLCPVGSNDNETLYLSYDGNDPDDDDNVMMMIMMMLKDCESTLLKCTIVSFGGNDDLCDVDVDTEDDDNSHDNGDAHNDDGNANENDNDGK